MLQLNVNRLLYWNKIIIVKMIVNLFTPSTLVKVEPSSVVTVTSARPSAEPASLPSDESLRKDIPIPAKNLTAVAEEPITSVVKSDDVKAEIESKLLNLPPKFTIVKSEEDRKRMFSSFVGQINNVQIDGVLLPLPLLESALGSRNVILTFESVDEILTCDHSNESYGAVLYCGAVYYAVQGSSNF